MSDDVKDCMTSGEVLAIGERQITIQDVVHVHSEVISAMTVETITCTPDAHSSRLRYIEYSAKLKVYSAWAFVLAFTERA